jgi:hypothetical protein
MAEHRRQPPDAELERSLRDLAAELDFPPTPSVAPRVRARLAERPRLRPPSPFWRPRLTPVWLAGAAALLAVLLAGLVLVVSPGTRDAVAGRLGLRGVHIAVVPTLPPLPPGRGGTPATSTTSVATPSSSQASATPATPGEALQLGTLTTVDAAQAATGLRVLIPAALGNPDLVYLDTTVPGGAVSLVYAPRPGLPETPQTGVGLLLTEFRGNIQPALLGKAAGPGTTLTPAVVGGEPGWWLAGTPHIVFYQAPKGEVRQDRIRLAGNTLLWEHGNLTLRLESGLSRDEAVRVAESAR